jgi:ADP-heptose:LPS heptosyltransferase
MRIIVSLDYLLKNLFLRFLSFILFPGLKKQQPSRILIFRTGSIGDSICSLPAIQALRQTFPEAELDILTHSGGFKGISLENILQPGIADHFINYENISREELITCLRIRNYDLFILFPQAHAPFKRFVRDMLFARMIGVRRVAGFKICVTRLFARWQAKHRLIPNVREFLLSIAREAGAMSVSSIKFLLNIRKEDEMVVNKLFQQYALHKQDKLIAFTLGAKRPQNRWPVSYFNQVVDYVQSLGYTCLMIGGHDDNDQVGALQTSLPVINLCGSLTVMQSAEVLRRCRLMVTNDTGPMHLAYAVGTYVIAIFSSRDYPGLWYPPGDASTVFRNNDIHCAACFSETCKENVCMQGIKADEVMRKIDDILEDQG